MKTLQLLLLALLASCASVRPDVLTDTEPDIAAVGARLVTELGLGRSVYIQDGDLLPQGRLGLSQQWDGMYLITLEESLPPREKWMVLIHELAHVVVWESKDKDPGHGPAWGRAYSKVYRLAVPGP